MVPQSFDAVQTISLFWIMFPVWSITPCCGLLLFLGHMLQEWLRQLQKTDAQCVTLLTYNGVSLDGWAGIFLEVKDMRHFLWLYTCI